MTSPARTSRAAITAKAGEDLERVWPAVAERLGRMLAARGVPREAHEDICQEVACRIVARGVPFTDATDLYPWASTAARRLATDLHRREQRLALVDPPDRAAPIDVASLVEARTRLRAVVDAMPRLSATDRAAIVDIDVVAARSRREAVREAVRRHRARARLLAMVEAAGAVLAWVLGRLPGRRLGKTAGVVAIGATPMLILALSLPQPAPPAGQASSPEKEERRGALVVGQQAAGSTAAGMAAPAPVAAGTPRPAAQQVRAQAPADPPAEPDFEVSTPVPATDETAVAGVRDRTEDDADACVLVEHERVFCVDATETLLDRLGM